MSTKIDRVTIYSGHLEPEKDWSWVLNVVRIDCEGFSGWGEAGTTYYRPAVGTAETLRVLATFDLLGADPMRNVSLWRKMVGTVDGAYHGGAIGFGAVAACDMALWDLKGKLLSQPVHSLLGGKHRSDLRAYANGWCYRRESPSEYAEAALRVKEDGFTAMKFDPFRYDEGGFKEHPEPGQSTTRKWVKIAADRVAAVREAIGPDTDLILEAHGKFSPSVAIEIGRRFSEFDFLYYEEPIKSDHPEALRRIADQQPIPVASGERFCRIEEMRPYVEAQSFALAQPDLGVCGGITAGKRMAELCDLHEIGFQPHNSALALNTAAAYQLCSTLPNFVIQETFPYRPDDWYGILRNPYEKRIRSGYLQVADTPGLDIEVDEAWLEKRLTRQEFKL